MLQRLYRLKDAPSYLGIDRNVFNRDVRPELSEIRHGKAVLFDRLELDAWADYKKSRAGRPPQRRAKWQEKERQDSANVEASGISRSESKGTAGSMKLLARQIGQRRNAT